MIATIKQFFINNRGPFSLAAGVIVSILIILVYRSSPSFRNFLKFYHKLAIGFLMTFLIVTSSFYFVIKMGIDPALTETDIREIFSVLVAIIALMGILRK